MTLNKFPYNWLKCVPILIVFGILFSCENDVKEVNALMNGKNEPVSKGKNVEFVYSEKSDVKIKITAPLMEEFGADASRYIEMSEGVKVLFYDSLLNISSTLTANYAIHRAGDRIMEAKDDVVVVNDKGEMLNTDHLIWNEDSAKIYCNEQVKITTENQMIMGKGMVANQDFTDWKIFKITGIINVEEEEDSSSVKN